MVCNNQEIANNGQICPLTHNMMTITHDQKQGSLSIFLHLIANYGYKASQGPYIECL